MKRFAIWRDWLLALLSVTQGGGELPRAGGVLRVFLHEKHEGRCFVGRWYMRRRAQRLRQARCTIANND